MPRPAPRSPVSTAPWTSAAPSPHGTPPLAAGWTAAPVPVHGDIAAGNLLLVDGRLAAVIDWGCAAIGDPSTDLVIAWTFLTPESRAAFRAALPDDPATWARARGWALWKAAITLAAGGSSHPAEHDPLAVLTSVLEESGS